MPNFFHVAALTAGQANNLEGQYLTASIANGNGLKTVALPDVNFNEWVARDVISEKAAPPQTAIQKLDDLRGLPFDTYVAVMPAESSSISEVTTCNLYAFETEPTFLTQGWQIPDYDGTTIAPAGTAWTTIAEGAIAISQKGGLLYYFDNLSSDNEILG